MCGIAGFFSQQPISGEEYFNIHNSMANRGPDDEGFAVICGGKANFYSGERSCNDAGPSIKSCEKVFEIMSHVRLSIIDLTEAGHQPFLSDDGRYIMTYNGEVYNYLELRNQLIGKGYRFRTETDTEVVLKAFQEWGTDSFNRFNGMWALAIYDLLSGKVILSRDRFGIKPLYYAALSTGFAFASTMSVVRQLIIHTTPNMKVIDTYLQRGKIAINKETFYNEINELEPGCFAEISTDYKVKITKYWKFKPYYRKISFDDAIEYFTDIFSDSVCLRMRSDVEVGSLLSGGLDSTTIVGTLKCEGLMSDRYQTFSSVYDEEEYSEKKYIVESQKEIGFNANYIHISAEEALGLTDRTIEAIEMPYRSASANLQYKLYQQIHDTSAIKVVLNGQGADELFGGYTADYANCFAELLCTGRISKFKKEISSFCQMRKTNRKSVLFSIFRAIIVAGGMHGRNTFNRAQFTEVEVSALREYLTYDDRLSMAFGIEPRAPFLDYRLVEFAFSLGSEYKINEKYNKSIVRHYAKNKIPEMVLERKDKMGFVSPQEKWQHTEWEKAFDKEFDEIGRQGLFQYDGRKLLEEYFRYKKNFTDWTRIWRIFCLSRWKKVMGME